MYTKRVFVNVGLLTVIIFGFAAFATIPAFAQTDNYGAGTTSGTYCPQLFQTVVRGSSGNQVLELQKFLSDYYNIPQATIQTGYFGRITQGYVIQFQKEQGLPSYGIAGSMTRAAIARVCNNILVVPPVSGSLQVYPTSGQAPLGVYFWYNLDAGSAEGYSISFGDGTDGTLSIGCAVNPMSGVSACPRGLTANHTYTANGTYTATLVQKSACPFVGDGPCYQDQTPYSRTVGSVTITVRSGVVPPPTNVNCTADSMCPSNYYCKMIEGSYGSCSATIYPNGGGQSQPVCTPNVITKGICTPNPTKEGGSCTTSDDCQSGLFCYAGICKNPTGNVCSGPSDTSCSTGYQCTPDCGPPVVSQYDTQPTTYHCRIPSAPRMCPICLASNTKIATPNGDVNVKDITIGTLVWSQSALGEKIESTVVNIGHTAVPVSHRVIHLVLSDSREVWVSPNHPTFNGRVVGDLKVGDAYDGSNVKTVESVAYWDKNTYDILPNSQTGFYWADGILFGSTLK